MGAATHQTTETLTASALGGISKFESNVIVWLVLWKGPIYAMATSERNADKTSAANTKARKVPSKENKSEQQWLHIQRSSRVNMDKKQLLKHTKDA
eukprot:433072-Amphidinium_carterae.1